MLRAEGYHARGYYESDSTLRAVVDAIRDGAFSPSEHSRYRGLMDTLLNRDAYLLFADFAAYLEAQEQVDALFRQPQQWARRAVLNIAGMGGFSSDRTIRDYAETIWNIPLGD